MLDVTLTWLKFKSIWLADDSTSFCYCGRW